ncbi:hypothetical protein ACIQFU_24840 [Streptomyces sp. NPDC093065]|uniref:hypothetical protein n=1 Tax=Streptomyces sp. NPDC093065 TaxID=3366021 RepID=UPI0038297D39
MSTRLPDEARPADAHLQESGWTYSRWVYFQDSDRRAEGLQETPLRDNAHLEFAL